MNRMYSLGFAVGLVSVLLSMPLQARNDDDRQWRHSAPVKQARQASRRQSNDDDEWRKKAHKRGYIRDDRHRHKHYYPRRGYETHRLPRGYRVVPYRNSRYYFNSGAWYRRYRDRYVVVRPPIGLRINVLPPFYTTVWFGRVPYYYAGGVYYLWDPPQRTYIVAKPPAQAGVEAEEKESDNLFIYPKAGQNEDQQAKDRYECHSWGVEQTGFDPTMPNGNVELSDYAGKRAEYFRAMKACLEGREYSVR